MKKRITARYPCECIFAGKGYGDDFTASDGRRSHFFDVKPIRRSPLCRLPHTYDGMYMLVQSPQTAAAINEVLAAGGRDIRYSTPQSVVEYKYTSASV